MRPIATDVMFCGLCVCVAEHTAKRCKNGWADHDAVSVVDSRTAKEPCIRLGAHRRHLANMIKRSVHGGVHCLLSDIYKVYEWNHLI